ncbi:MAG: hypothetical protein LBW85_13775 [Deltaproteobacteria bacterium]|nr:hypothetical protein [Deltaproteobacteria bacterium]
MQETKRETREPRREKAAPGTRAHLKDEPRRGGADSAESGKDFSLRQHGEPGRDAPVAGRRDGCGIRVQEAPARPLDEEGPAFLGRSAVRSCLSAIRKRLEEAGWSPCPEAKWLQDEESRLCDAAEAAEATESVRGRILNLGSLSWRALALPKA